MSQHETSLVAQLIVSGAAGGSGALVALLISRWMVRRSPPCLMRTNIDGIQVPAVLGIGVVAGGLVGLWVATTADPDVAGRLEVTDLVPAAGVVLIGLAAAGLWDDLRGDERPRGFSGHWGALRGGRITGGVVKLLVGGGTGLLAGAIVTTDAVSIVLTGASVALGANLINLLDRAPGRAAKFTLVLAAPVLIAGDLEWFLVASGTLGALSATLPYDLRAKGMLGDAGANPLGGLLGLGLAGGPRTAQIGSVVLLLVANLASEKWSFSAAIERSAWLRGFDGWGRKRA